MLWPKKFHTRNLITKNNSPPPLRHKFSNGPPLTGDGCLRKPCFEKRSGLIIVESEMQENFPVECGILGFGIWNIALGIRNPTKDWNPESKFH